MHRILRVLALLLLQHALAPTGINARMRLPVNPDNNSINEVESRPYLQVAGTIPLRFAAAPRPIAQIIKQPVVSTPVNPTSAAPVESTPPSLAPASPVETTIAAVGIESQSASPKPANSKPTLSILPDDTRSSTRPEDFLPFFQFPSGDVTVIAPVHVTQPPAPGQQPASSATYQQR